MNNEKKGSYKIMKTIILISGKMRSGKNKLSNYISNELNHRNYKVTTDLFAYDLKNWCKEDFKPLSILLSNIKKEIKCQLDILFDQPNKFSIPSFESMMASINKSLSKLDFNDNNFYENKTDITRVLLQQYGTQIFRNRINENFWAEKLVKRCIESNSDFIIITDVRFPNEIEIFNKYISENINIVTIRVERDICKNNKHDSETSLDNWLTWNYCVDNNGTLDQLKLSALTIVDDILNPVNEYIELDLCELMKK